MDEAGSTTQLKRSLIFSESGQAGSSSHRNVQFTAARISAFSAFSLILSPSRISMARRVLPSRLELKRPDGSSNAAPLARSSSRQLVGLAGADDSVVLPHWNATPLPFFDHVGNGLLDDAPDPSQHLARNHQLLDSSVESGERESLPLFFSEPLLLFIVAVAFFMIVVVARRSHSFAWQLAGVLHPGGEFELRRAGRPHICRGSACPGSWTRRAGEGAATCRGRTSL